MSEHDRILQTHLKVYKFHGPRDVTVQVPTLRGRSRASEAYSAAVEAGHAIRLYVDGRVPVERAETVACGERTEGGIRCRLYRVAF